MKLMRALLENRFMILAAILIITNFIVFGTIIWFKYPIYTYYDGWFLFVWEFKKFLLNPSFVMFSDIESTGFQMAGYWHAGCPLYPFIAAGVSIIGGNVIASMIITSAMFSILGIYFIKKIAKEFMNYDDAHSYQLICIFVSFSFVSEFFFVPLPISITITIPIMDTYYFLRFFHSPSLKNKLLLTSVFTLTLFTRELIFPFLLVPLSVLVLLKIKNSIQHPEYDLNFRHRFIVLLCTTILIPCGIYAIYLLATRTYASLIVSWAAIVCPKTLTWFFYSVFNTITFDWIFVLLSLFIFLRVSTKNFRKSKEIPQQIAPKSGINGIILENHDENTRADEQISGIDPPGDGFMQRNLVDYTNGTWLALLFFSRVFLPGCPIEAYFLPSGFVLAVYVLKGIRITSKPHLREYLFWLAITMNVVVLVTQVFVFYPFFDSDFSGFISEWLKKEIGWPFYP
jgi:hypothetical protein